MTVLLPYLDTAMGQIESLARNSRPAPAFPDLNGADLTSFEGEILDLIRAGKTNTEIAIILGISPVALRNPLRKFQETL